MIKAILFDFIGTTVKEADNDVINQCFANAFSDHKIHVDPLVFSKNRGLDKKIIIENVLKEQQLLLTLKESIYSSFKSNIIININKFYENDGTAEILMYLSRKGIKRGIGTGLERDVFETISRNINWNTDVFDYIGIATEIGKSRPEPDIIYDMMHQLGISDPQEMIKVGDTVADIQEGKNAGVLTVVILSGTQPDQALIDEGPDFVIKSLIELKDIIS